MKQKMYEIRCIFAPPPQQPPPQQQHRQSWTKRQNTKQIFYLKEHPF
jgi:hypothetical protein